MKKKFNKSIILLLIICAISYGYYIYQINNPENTTDNMNVEMDQENSLVNEGEGDSANLESNTREESDANQEIDKSREKKEEPDDLKLYATSAVLLDASSNRILYEKNGHQKMPMASTTKIMNLIVTLENANLDDIVTVSSNAARMPDVQLNIRTGEKYKLRDLLYSLMLESHNDSAVAIAEHVGGSVEGFAAMMNQKAKDIGSNDTYFITPNGLDATDANGTHSTTAADLARIMSYCIKESPMKEEFLKITRTANYSFTDIAGKRSYSCNNHNAFLNMMQGALSGKTGFTGNAGYCYVGALERDGKTFVVTLLACGWPNHKTWKWSDTQKLMNYGLKNYEYRSFNEVELNEARLQPIIVENGQTNYIGGTATIGLNVNTQDYGMLMREGEEIEVVYDVVKNLEAPVAEGMVVGEIKYLVDGDVCKVDTIVTNAGVDKIDYDWCMKKVLGEFLE